MFRKILKWIGIVLGVLVGLIIVALIALYAITEAQMNATYSIPPSGIQVPNDAASVARGKHLVEDLLFCRECHGPLLSGQVLIDDPLTARFATANLTSGLGGAGRKFKSDEDWVRAIRHGVKPDGKPLVAMPANLYYELGNADLAAVIAYLKSLPPVDNEAPPPYFGPLGRPYFLLMPEIVPAASISHTAPRPPAPSPGVTAEYGGYIALPCRNCHGKDLAGNPNRSGGLNLTPGGELARWSEADFFRAIREGIIPTGETLDSEKMPWRILRNLTDDELRALWLYLKSLPAKADVGPTPTRNR